MSECASDYCDREAVKRGYCTSCYGRGWRSGQWPPPPPKTTTHLPLKERLLARSVRDENGCLRWTGALDGKGYGRIYLGGGKAGARITGTHQAAYREWVGPIPDGMEIDHLCKVTDCLEPTHLEAVTHRENILRSDNFAGRFARQTHCKYGHEFTPENTYVPLKRGGRHCRECHRIYEAERRARLKAERS